MAERADIDFGELKTALVGRREELVRHAEATEEARQPVEVDQSRVGRLSRLDAIQAQEMALETERRHRLEVQLIDAALKRMEEGEYGYCLSCGEEIAAERVAHDPAVPTCIDCARRADGRH